MEPIEISSEARRLASFLRRMWPDGSSARLRLTELPTCGISLLSLETRDLSGDWIRRVQLQVDQGVILAVADDLGIEMRTEGIRPPRSVGLTSRMATAAAPPH